MEVVLILIVGGAAGASILSLISEFRWKRAVERRLLTVERSIKRGPDA